MIYITDYDKFGAVIEARSIPDEIDPSHGWIADTLHLDGLPVGQISVDYKDGRKRVFRGDRS